MLSRRSSPLLWPPRDSLPAIPPLPGSSGYRRASLPVLQAKSVSLRSSARRPGLLGQPVILDGLVVPLSRGWLSASHPAFGAEEGLPRTCDNLLTVQLPIRRRVLWHPLQVLWCRPWQMGRVSARLTYVRLDSPSTSRPARASQTVRSPCRTRQRGRRGQSGRGG